MSKIIPNKLSNEVLNNPRIQGEIKVYKCLKNRLGNDWTTFYSVPWLGKVFSSANRRDGEIDFVIANPKYGIIVAEVKGGKIIEFDGIAGQWYSTSQSCSRNEIKDPYIQSKNNKYSLINEISSMRGWEKGLEGINICHIVIFPDVSTIKEGNLPMHAKKEITIFEDDLSNISNRLINSIVFSCNKALTNSDKTNRLILDITQAIAPELEIKRKIVHSIADDNEAIMKLTEQQEVAFKLLSKIKRVSVSGCAGSGKTLLAIRSAKKSADAKKTTLLCCYNVLLGDKFSDIAQQNDLITGGNFHSIIKDILIDRFGYDTNFVSRILFDDEKLLSVLVENTMPLFDSIIIDETQDFSKDQLDILQLMCQPESSLYCFWDNNQRLLRSDFELPHNMEQIALDTNLRNTKKIFNEVKKYYYQTEAIYNEGPEGLDVKLCKPYNAFRKSDLYQKLSTIIIELIYEEGIPANEIAILTFKSKENSTLAEFNINGIKLSAFNNRLPLDGVIIETARRFKGLESAVVILTELDDYSATQDTELWENLCYVSMSRARNYLIILPPNNCKDIIFI